VVEIDPFTPGSTPKKRTALGRMGHEGACLGPVVAGKPLVWYMGDDSRNEYIYKFVSTKNWDAADANGGLAAGDKYMDDGRLYVAKFNADGTGAWLELKLGVNGITASNAAYAFADAADVVINARLAADAAGATKMDRPEWTAVNPKTGEVYVTLTNTNGASRPITATDAANPRYYNDPKGAAATAQTGNPNGHVVRFADDNGDPAALSFKWDVYLFGARAGAAADINLSGLVADNDFSSPDGLWFSQATGGLLWLETDDGAYTDVTNCMLLAALPGRVGDGAAKTITNVDGATTRQQATFVGKAPGTEGLRRFLVGPKDCEITGIAESGDGRALFVNIQHPGETTPVANIGNPALFGSHWPDGGNARPRSATVVITKDDGGLVGL
jgi:secreted PhoX family phosphatase